MENQYSTYDVMKVCLLAGKIMLQSGGETYRVEDTMIRIAAAYGVEHSHPFVTPTGIIFSLEGAEPTKTKLVRIMDRTTDLRKVTMVNSISRQITNGELTMAEAYKLLRDVEASNDSYHFSLQLAAASLASGCFVIMFLGTWYDFIPAIVAGGIGFLFYVYANRLIPLKFFAEFTASVVIGVVAYLFVYIGIGHELDKIIIGSVMPLVPGLLITNAVRDLIAGHLVSGLSKGAEAFLTAFAIGSGVAVVFAFI
ncbi:threonine/serine exporter [Bacillus sp. HMF5848]|uniref:threonine/serine exporter family protein n=1 Tax=Bacillus sp. HMF5848 TaxID=2495421 RepID=UPI000F7AC80D|nr:threonine/serine exporter family protein [Bacillus sp. HMF5848]RSK26665.1 threonine/serine exporter [Bacillus sp. HMF5848]